MGDTSTPCPLCRGTGHVCENHPTRLWGGICCDSRTVTAELCIHGACHCGAGVPCPTCTRPVTGARIEDAFRSCPMTPEAATTARLAADAVPPVLTGGMHAGGHRA